MAPPVLEESTDAAVAAAAATPRGGATSGRGLFHPARGNRGSTKKSPHSKTSDDEQKEAAATTASPAQSSGSVAETGSLRSISPTEETSSKSSSLSSSSLPVDDSHPDSSVKALNNDNTTANTSDEDDGVGGVDGGWNEVSVQAVVQCWKLSEEQTAKLNELGERLRADDDNDDSGRVSSKNHSQNTPDQVIRFLHDSNYNVKAAETMFRNMLAWREKMGVDEMLSTWDEFPRAVFENIPGAVLRTGVDKDGDLIMVDLCSRADALGIIQRYGVKTMVDHAMTTREIMAGLLRQRHLEQVAAVKSGSSSSGSGRILLISDMGGLSRRHLHGKVLGAFSQISRMDQDNYPGVAKRIIVINANAMYRMIWSVVKHFLDPHMRAMITVCGDKKNYRQVLQEQVGDLKVLPSVIVPEGEASAAVKDGMNPYWEGRPLPPAGDDE